MKKTIWIGILAISILGLVLSGCSSQKCETWRTEGNINTPSDWTPKSDAFDSTCPQNYVCIVGNTNSEWASSYGHTKENPAVGMCKKAFTFSD